jgi:sporulation protein YlmC with PRC-barrel domain
MKRIIFVTSVAGLLWSCPSALLLAAQPAPGAVQAPAMAETTAPVAKPVASCLADVRAFNGQLGRDGYWLGGSDYGYGYPMGGYGYGYGNPTDGSTVATDDGYLNARPGYEVRTLIISADILGQHGANQPCEDVLGTARQIYATYTNDLRGRGVSGIDGADWQRQQVATAQPVTGQTKVFRSEQLLDTDVLDPQNQSLGRVHDLVLQPQSGKIAYLVIGRGGFLGFDEAYIPVPWTDFKVTQNGNLLVLDTTKALMDAAPQVQKDRFAQSGHYDQERQVVDQYWQAHLMNKASN